MKNLSFALHIALIIAGVIVLCGIFSVGVMALAEARDANIYAAAALCIFFTGYIGTFAKLVIVDIIDEHKRNKGRA